MNFVVRAKRNESEYFLKSVVRKLNGTFHEKRERERERERERLSWRRHKCFTHNPLCFHFLRFSSFIFRRWGLGDWG